MILQNLMIGFIGIKFLTLHWTICCIGYAYQIVVMHLCVSPFVSIGVSAELRDWVQDFCKECLTLQQNIFVSVHAMNLSQSIY